MRAAMPVRQSHVFPWQSFDLVHAAGAKMLPADELARQRAQIARGDLDAVEPVDVCQVFMHFSDPVLRILAIV